MVDAFFRLLRIAIGKESCLSFSPTAEGWMGIFTMTQQQTLVGVMFVGIERLPVEQRPPRQILLQWYAMTERIKQTNRLLNQRAVETVAYFQKEGFESCVLKGQGVATCYPQPLLRTSGDIDIWLDGGHKRIHDFARSKVGLQGLTYHHLHYPLFEETEVEVHITPGNLSSPPLNRKLQRYFKEAFNSQTFHRVVLPEGVGEITVPDVEFNLFYLLLHMYKHLTGQGIGLRQMMDYYYALQQPISDEARTRVVLRIREYKMMRFARATMYVMRKVFGLDEAYMLVAPDEKSGRFLLDEIMLAGNFGKYDSRLKRKRKETPWYRLVRSMKRNIRFLRYYPNEIFWDPIFRTWQFFWRMGKK